MNQLYDPTPEFPDDTPIAHIRFPSRIRNVLVAEGLTTVGEVRDASDAMLLTLQNFGHASVTYLRRALGRRNTSGLPKS
jgi:DNA-directed RNA polymerase alpha subunit